MSTTTPGTDLQPTAATTTKELDALHTEHGDTTIADTVVEKLAIIASREVPGVYAMGNAARRAIGNLTGRISAQNISSGGGVRIEKGEREARVSVNVVVDYGVSIVAVSQGIRDNVIKAVEYGTGLQVTSVDVDVSDVHLPDSETDPASSTASTDLN